MNITAWLHGTRLDLTYGVRQLKSNPGFAAIAILSLALGIGANTAIFQLVSAINLKMLPVQNPDELVSIDYAKPSARSGWWASRNAALTYAQWEQLREHRQPFSGVLAWSDARFNLSNGGEPRFAEGLYVSGDFFHTLGVNAVVGRTLTTHDDSQACNVGAVLSNAFWQREFAGDPGVLGRTVSLDGHSIPVIGVTPPAFFGLEVGSRYDVAIPICADRLMAEDNKGRMTQPTTWWLAMMGRLKPGWTVKSATAYVQALSPQIMRATLPPEYRPDFAKRFLANKLVAKDAGTGISGLRQQYQRPLWLLMAISGLVLIIACGNLANLLLARATVREPEMAVRLAIGASRWRLVRQLLAESLLLAIAGATLGIGLALALSRSLVAFISTPDNPIFVDASVDWRVLTFTAGLAVLTCIVFGLLPALRGTYLSPASAMRSGGRSVTAGRERFSIRRALVATQVALSLVLLVGALLFVRSLHNLLTTDPGFRSEGMLVANIDFSKARFDKQRRPAVYRELSDRLARVPGIVSVAQVGFTPVNSNGGGWDQHIGPDEKPAAGTNNTAFLNRCAPGYFRTMGTRLLAGREFSERDTLHSPKVAIVNEVFAKKYFGGANPVGRRFHLEAAAGQAEPSFEIVGLVANTKYYELREEFRPLAYFPIEQNDAPEPNATYIIRMAGHPGQVTNHAKEAVTAMSPSIGIDFRPFSQQLKESLLRERLMATLSGGFGFLAAVLATLGIYGVVAYMVAGRRNEIGLRIALGANKLSVIGLVLRETFLLLVAGLAVGIMLALWTGRAAAALLFDIKPNDLVTLLAASVLLTLTALLASYIPARRAAALDPMTTLRSD